MLHQEKNISELKSNRALKIRTDSVEEILTTELTRVRDYLAGGKELLQGLPDLARGLCRIQYGKVYLPHIRDVWSFDYIFSVHRKSWRSYFVPSTKLQRHTINL